MDIEQLVGQRIRMTRQISNLSQEDLAARCGQTQWQISNTENAQRHITVAELAAIAEALGRPLSWFLGEDVVQVPPPERSLRSDHRDMPPEAYEEIASFIRWIENKYGKKGDRNG